ncbi:spermatogenesis-associated protein 4 [Anas platyrhynchos]|uniref:spermatogenesis-associated protein 4 n=1 Tax=Anas platyrhynchos TaxID=8839 RepID=UPI000F7C2ABE|nr:spermatogenesis-associated protein 4 [Anas platyrhynchos]|eukprot:XP_027312182.1 spermatogenesis-associated protein 4 [Anas platyrhynchos]
MAPRQPGLPRAVLRWLQSLDLPACPRHCRRDFSNGYLVAEILARYFPAEIRSRACGTGSSLPTKLSNWARLQRFFAKHNLSVAQELIEGTIHCKPGAAERLVQDIYSLLTNRCIKSLQDREIDFTDYCYQTQLPMVARSTASKAIKNNIRLTEIMMEPSVTINRQKANAVINMHMRMRMQEREEDPRRFNIKRSFRHHTVYHLNCTTSSTNIASIPKEKAFAPSYSSGKTDKTDVHYEELQEQQADRSSVMIVI